MCSLGGQGHDKERRRKPLSTHLQEVLDEGYYDPAFFCQEFLPHLFPKDFEWFHLGIIAVLVRRADWLSKYPEVVDKIIKNFLTCENWDDPEAKKTPIFYWDMEGVEPEMRLGKYTLLMIPRGFAKTTIAGVGITLWKILYQEVPFFVYVSEAAPHAKMQLTNVKRELESNERIISAFGNVKPEARDPEKWREDFFETKSGVAMTARGRGGQIRGLNHRGLRPLEIIFDDVEDKESVSTEEQRKKTREWLFADVLPALPELNPKATATGLGTLLHRDALLSRLCHDGQWTVVRLGALDVDGFPIWPDNMSLEKLETRKQSYVKAGLLDVFYMEYFNTPFAAETQIIAYEHIHWSQPEGVEYTAIYVDPAISEKRTADSSVIIVVGMGKNGRIWVLDGWGKRGANPREIIDMYFELAKKWKCQQHGVESIAWQRALVHLIQEEMFRKNYYFEVVAVTHGRVEKYERIKGVLAPRYRSGYIHHARRFGELETQLLDLKPGNKGHDDWPDAEAGAITLLDPYAAAAAGEIDLGKDEYTTTIEEEIGEWRWVS